MRTHKTELAEFDKWRRAGVPAELLKDQVSADINVATEGRLSPRVEEFDERLSAIVAAAGQLTAGAVASEGAR